MRFKVKGKDFIMEETFERINSNKHFNKNLIPYKEKLLIETLKFFEEKEDYEKCEIINNFIKNRFNHEVGYKLKKETI